MAGDSCKMVSYFLHWSHASLDIFGNFRDPLPPWNYLLEFLEEFSLQEWMIHCFTAFAAEETSVR